MSPGTFAWRDLMSTDPAAAAGFYGELFGWACRNGRFLRDGAPVAGIVALDAELGWPSHWLPYVSVEDVDAVVGKAMAHGGMPLHPPAETPGGRFAVLGDPAGAAIGVLSGEAPAKLAGAGAISWDELLTDDDAVRRFYVRAFGYTAGIADMGPLGAGWVLKQGGEPRASILASPDATPPLWVPFVEGSPEAAFARVESLGGRVIRGVVDLGEGGRSCVLADPSGAVFGVLG